MAFIGVIHSTIEEIIKSSSHPETETWLKVHSFWSMIHGLVSINLMSAPVSHLGMTQVEFNKAILKDFIKGFIKGLTE